MKGLAGMILGSKPEDDRDLSKSEEDNDKTLNYAHSEAIQKQKDIPQKKSLFFIFFLIKLHKFSLLRELYI